MLSFHTPLFKNKTSVHGRRNRVFSYFHRQHIKLIARSSRSSSHTCIYKWIRFEFRISEFFLNFYDTFKYIKIIEDHLILVK